MRRRHRRWHVTTGAIILLVCLAAIGAGVVFGRTIIGALGHRAPTAAGGGQIDAGGQSGSGSPTGQAGQTGQTGQTGQSGQAGGPAPVIAEVQFSLPGLVTFNVQAGRFDSRDNADNLVTSLIKAGYPAWSTGAPPYRVYVGAFADKKNAIALATKLKAERPGDCGSAWATSIAAPSINKTVSGTDKAGLEAISTALATVSEMAAKEAALWDARAKDALKPADLKALSDAYSAKLSKAASDVRAASAADSALRDKTLTAIVAAQNNLAKVNSLAAGGTSGQYSDASASLIEVTELYAEAVATLTPVGN